MITEDLEIINKLGLHARAAAKLVQCAQAHSASITLAAGAKKADAKSIMNVMMLGASQGTMLTVTVDGDDEAEAWAALKDLVDRKFDEGE